MIRRLIPVAVALALLVSACGTGDLEEAAPPETAPPSIVTTTVPELPVPTLPPETTTTAPGVEGFPVTIDAPNGPVTIDAKPERIISISPTSTEVLFAIGAGPQVIAVDNLSNFPEEAPMTDLAAFTPSVEAIAALEPDLVFLSFDPGDVIAGLEAIGIPVILHGAAVSLEDAYAQWEQVGAATGNIADAARVVADTMTRINTAIELLPEGTDAITYYYELDATFFSATSETFIGGLFSLAGMQNIADAVDVDGFGFPQLTAEYIIDSDPTLIFLAHGTSDTVSERPGWETLTAVTYGNIVELDADISSRWGPRIADLMEAVVDAILVMEPTNA